MNRKERRTKGKAIVERLSQLRNSKVLQALDMKDIPQETLDALIAGTCENLCLQKRYNLQKNILDETIRLEIELYNAKIDLENKRSIIKSK